MWSDRITKLIESATSANEIFEQWISPEQAEKLEEQFGELAKTQAGQKEILNRASHQDMDAVMYLYSRYLKLTTKVFWKYYIGPDRELGMRRIYNGDAADVASKAIELLAGVNTPNPYATWKADLYRDDPNVDLIKQFSYWYSRYLQNECVKLYKDENTAGLSGVRNKDAVQTASIDATDISRNADLGEDFSDEFEDVTSSEPEVVVSDDDVAESDEAASESFESGADIKAMIRDFKAYLKTFKNRNRYTIFNLRLQGLTPEEIQEETGLSRQNISKYWQQIIQMWVERYPETKNMIG